MFEITNADTGRIVDTMTSDSRGIAASNPIPLGRYYVQEVQAPRFYQLNSEKVEVKLKVEGDVVQIEMYNDAANINTTIEKTGNYTVDAGSNMRYDSRTSQTTRMCRWIISSGMTVSRQTLSAQQRSRPAPTMPASGTKSLTKPM